MSNGTSSWVNKLEAATGIKVTPAKSKVATNRQSPPKSAKRKTNDRYIPSSERISFIAFDALKKYPTADDGAIKAIVKFIFGHMPTRKEINAARLIVKSRKKAATKDFLLQDMAPEVVEAHKLFLALSLEQRASFIDLIAFEIDDVVSEGAPT